jgi:glyoxylase-like metal-dependent hydrolase (beta-lactamase superfamily II)
MRDVFFLTCGGFVARACAFRPGDGSVRSALGEVRLSNTVAVAVRTDGELVLVDAGWSQDACADAGGALGRLHARVFGVRVRPEDAIASQLRSLGLAPARVRAIVATHLHLDHVGGVVDFPNAEVIVAQRELKAYWGAPFDFGYRARDLARAGRIRAVTLEAGPTYGFPASADPYGDGEIVLLDARGHTPGSVAVALRSPRGTYVHAGDAAYQRWEYGMSPQGPCLVARLRGRGRGDVSAAYRSLRSCEADPRRPTVVVSHDLETFERLPHVPAGSGDTSEVSRRLF